MDLRGNTHFTLVTGDTFTFSVKINCTDNISHIDFICPKLNITRTLIKKNNLFIFLLTAAETSALKAGSYSYELKTYFTYAGVKTFIHHGILSVTEGVPSDNTDNGLCDDLSDSYSYDQEPDITINILDIINVLPAAYHNYSIYLTEDESVDSSFINKLNEYLEDPIVKTLHIYISDDIGVVYSLTDPHVIKESEELYFIKGTDYRTDDKLDITIQKVDDTYSFILDVQEPIPECPNDTDGIYQLFCTVAEGQRIYSWVKQEEEE